MVTELVTVVLSWQRTAPAERHEFEAHAHGRVFRAFRHRTAYGWSWWEVTIDGKPASSSLTGRTELPQSFQEWR